MPARFVAITPQLAFIRETHRLVLSWAAIGSGAAKACTVTLRKRELAGLAAAVATEPVAWSNDSGTLQVEGTAERVLLRLRAAHGEGHGELVLQGLDLARFRTVLDERTSD